MGEVRYWETVVDTWNAARPQTLWRFHSDAVNLALVARWPAEGRVTRLLKTDAFDEALGDGLYPFLVSKAEQVVSVDISVSVLSAARSRHIGLPAIRADVRRLPFADDVFDVVVSNSTLDHFASLDEIVTSLLELHRVLREGGQLLLTLDNLANPIIALRSVLPFRLLHCLGIVPYYVGATCGPYRLRRMLQRAGFEVREVSAVMHCPRMVAVALAYVLERYATVETQRRFLRFLMAFESLSCWPIRFLTGYFVAVRAIKH